MVRASGFQARPSRRNLHRAARNPESSFCGAAKGGGAMKLPPATPTDGQEPVSSGNGKGNATFERLGECLYWKGGKIVARVRVGGKQTWRSTGTSEPSDARAWLK